VRRSPALSSLNDRKIGMTEHPVWPLLPLQEQLAPWLLLFIGFAITIALVILVVDSVERL
jgi:hypothetical protein